MIMGRTISNYKFGRCR